MIASKKIKKQFYINKPKPSLSDVIHQINENNTKPLGFYIIFELFGLYLRHSNMNALRLVF